MGSTHHSFDQSPHGLFIESPHKMRGIVEEEQPQPCGWTITYNGVEEDYSFTTDTEEFGACGDISEIFEDWETTHTWLVWFNGVSRPNHTVTYTRHHEYQHLCGANPLDIFVEDEYVNYDGSPSDLGVVENLRYQRFTSVWCSIDYNVNCAQFYGDDESATYSDGGVKIYKSGSFSDFGPSITGDVVLIDPAHGLDTGDTVSVTNSTNHDGSHTVTVLNSGQFSLDSENYVSADSGDWERTAGVGDVILHDTAHGLSTGNEIHIPSGSYSGIHTVTVVDADEFSLDGVTFVDDSSGTWTRPNRTWCHDVAHGIATSELVDITGSSNPVYDGLDNATKVTNDIFSITNSFVGTASGNWAVFPGGSPSGSFTAVTGWTFASGSFDSARPGTAEAPAASGSFSSVSSTRTRATHDGDSTSGASICITGAGDYNGWYFGGRPSFNGWVADFGTVDATHIDLYTPYIANSSGTWIEIPGPANLDCDANHSQNGTGTLVISDSTRYDGSYAAGDWGADSGDNLLIKHPHLDTQTGTWTVGVDTGDIDAVTE